VEPARVGPNPNRALTIKRPDRVDILVAGNNTYNKRAPTVEILETKLPNPRAISRHDRRGIINSVADHDFCFVPLKERNYQGSELPRLLGGGTGSRSAL
jgi:hypothetical protein